MKKYLVVDDTDEFDDIEVCADNDHDAALLALKALRCRITVAIEQTEETE